MSTDAGPSSDEAGAAPVDNVHISVFTYSEDDCTEREAATAEEACAPPEPGRVTWINVDGVHDVKLIEKIGECFGLHPLLLEDIANTEQRPKTEDYGEVVFTTLKMLCPDEPGRPARIEQISLVLGRQFVLSFQERAGDVFDPVRDRLRRGKGRVRKAGADYLAYALLDAVVDGYFLVLERVGEELEGLEEEVADNPTPETAGRIREMKRRSLRSRKAVWPLREVVGVLARGELDLITPETIPYLRDVYDHTIQVVDTVETFRDVISGMRDTYLTVLSTRMNEVMKVLTIIATIFIPLTFVAGLYGMNFEFMPELKWRWAYPSALALMLAIAVVMLVYFKKKRWL